jgi:hypothetical protein
MELIETFRDTILTPVFYKNNNGAYLGFNTAFSSQILGVDKEAVIGKTLVELKGVIADEAISILHDRDMKRILTGGS